MRRRSTYPLRRKFPGMRQPLPIPPKLRETHKIFSTEKCQIAAELYLKLADKAVLRNISQTSNLYFRSSAAFMKADKIEKVKDALIKDLNWLLDKSKWK